MLNFNHHSPVLLVDIVTLDFPVHSVQDLLGLGLSPVDAVPTSRLREEEPRKDGYATESEL